MRAHRVVERAVVVGVGGAHVGERERAVAPGQPRHQEQAAPVLGHGDHHGDVVADLVPRHREVHALGWSHGGGAAAVAHRQQLVGPHAGGVHHDPGGHVDGVPVGGDGDARDAPDGVVPQRRHGGVGGHRGAQGCGRAGHGQREAGVVDLRVEVQVAVGQPVARHGGQVGQRLGAREALVQPPDAGAAGEVVEPHGLAQRPAHLAVHHAALGRDRDEEGQGAHQMGGVAQQSLALVQRLVHQPDLALLEVAEAAVGQLRRLGRRARGQVALVDQRHAQASARRVERHAGAGDAGADDQHVEGLVLQPTEGGGAVERRWDHRRGS